MSAVATGPTIRDGETAFFVSAPASGLSAQQSSMSLKLKRSMEEEEIRNSVCPISQ
jgi:hypothetical protein